MSVDRENVFAITEHGKDPEAVTLSLRYINYCKG